MSSNKVYELGADIHYMRTDAGSLTSNGAHGPHWESTWCLVALLFLLDIKESTEDVYLNRSYADYCGRMGKLVE